MASQVPDLESWAQSHIAALWESTEEDAFHGAFDSCFASNAETLINHEIVSLDKAKSDLLSTRFAAQSAKVEWQDISSLPKEGDDKVGIVAGFFNVTRKMKLRIRAAPAQRHTQVTFSAKIDHDSSVAGDSGDNRRIIHLWQTRVDKAAPINLARPHPPATD
ncbi:hypothetical protein GLOTRDRAFT_121554 [Gloeophyllum trabeum ATCC 11539]|uniref:SnoaL-like domain-containing protein n=1 Tax=Gloeophyllum trabeum (strain ATCC 11539 / FP-39264 / Madison 617) TaxID=670483 RepID=S7RR79_GLOTA|nr:uncharacterized protein GLOTRDRAFT_121554 [Gloeophyllum trabeum ATCC 11539]EPQ55434.1 hypothetical protein GLOTRDRAFT_121554 [Gloeophyllum trabeum ATCC 11539]